MLLALLIALELTPEPRPGAALLHGIGESMRLEHSLTLGLGAFPDVELRTTLDGARLGPVRAWLSWRVRRIDLGGLPPIEDYLSAGIGVTSDPERRLSLAAGVGVRFQLPPLAVEAADDLGTYFAENVRAAFSFAIRVRAW